MPTFKRLAQFVALSTVLAMAVGEWLVRSVLPYSIIKPRRVSRVRQIRPEALQLTATRFDCRGALGTRLVGWVFRTSQPPTRGTVVVMHGIASCKEDMLGLARLLTQNGFDVLVYDARAHGESEGVYCSYGYFESQDLSKAIEAVRQQDLSHGPFAVYANSYGGAVALLAMAKDPDIRCGVVESTFANLREIVNLYLKRIVWFAPQALSDAALNHAGLIAGFEPDAVSPEDAARMISQPVRLLHGTHDDRIPIAHGERIFRNLASKSKEWAPVPGGDHTNLWSSENGRYQRESVEFLKKHLQE
ncbi:MAG: alpha/beta fold hydrolase [Acidobacteriota bacterium]